MMEVKNNGFVFLASYVESIKDLDKDLRREVFEAIIFGGIYEEEINDLSPMAKALYSMCKPNIEKSVKLYKIRREAGKAPKPNNGRKKEFTPPSFDEVREYVLSQNYDEDVAKSFYGHLESIGFECNGYKEYFENWIKLK